jgi:methionine synthase II (cobalamin-independent)
MSDDLTTMPDRQLETAEFYADVRCAEHLEVDALYGDPDGPHPSVAADFEWRAALRDEIARREAAGITIDDPDEPSLEARLEPFGIEWQLEQRERAEGR